MLCQSCQKNLATLHLTEIVQAVKKETHLCEECAKNKGVNYSSQFSVKDYLSGLAKKSESSPGESDAAAAKKVVAAASLVEAFEPCPSCGISFGDFRQSGRLGCYHDYEHFKRGLVPLLEKMHNGHRQHTGRVPHKIGERIERQRQVADLKKQLQEAVAREEYERAAKLRDEIKGLEGGGAS